MWKYKPQAPLILLIIHQVMMCFSTEAMIFQTGSGCGQSTEIQISKFKPVQGTQNHLPPCSIIKVDEFEHLQAVVGKF